MIHSSSFPPPTQYDSLLHSVFTIFICKMLAEKPGPHSILPYRIHCRLARSQRMAAWDHGTSGGSKPRFRENIGSPTQIWGSFMASEASLARTASSLGY